MEQTTSNKRRIIWLWVLSIALWLVIAPLRGYYDLQWTAIIHSIVFALLTWWAMKRYAPTKGFWRTLLPLVAPWLIELPFHFLSDAMWTLPVTVIPLWAVITVALFYRYRKIWLLLLCSALWLLGVTEGYCQWVEWCNHGDNPTLTVNLAGCEVTDSTHTLKLSEIDAEFLVIDVWYSQCGACRKKMPEVEALRNEYKDDKNVEVISLFATLIEGETIDDGISLMQSMGCDVPVYAIDKDSPILKECNIDAYPRVLILDKERTVIFNGSLEFAKRKLKKAVPL